MCCRLSVTNKYSPALHSSLKHQLKYLCYQIVFFRTQVSLGSGLWVPVSPSTYIRELWLKLWLVSQKEGPLLSLFSWLWSLQELGTAHLPKDVNSKQERIVSQIDCFIFQQGVLIKCFWMHCHANMNFYLVPTDHYIVDFILLHGFQLQLTRVLDYKSCSHLQTALYSQLGTSITYFKVHVICSSIAGRLRVKSTFKKFRYVNNVSENIYVKSYTTFL